MVARGYIRRPGNDAEMHRPLFPPSFSGFQSRPRRRPISLVYLITGDLGGTSFDVSLVVDGEAALAAQTTVEFGMVIRTPMIEITTIGAGGGSIADVSELTNSLRVGPRSAGARTSAGSRPAQPHTPSCFGSAA